MTTRWKTPLLALCLACWLPACDDGAVVIRAAVVAGGAGGAPSELPETYPSLPGALVASPATVHGDTLVVAGGNRFEAHMGQSTEALNPDRYTLDLLDADAEWQAAPMDWRMQQGSLVSHGGALYQAGGMTFGNAPGEDVMLTSRPDLRRWDADADEWVDLPPMPGEFGRASHGTALAGSVLYLSGGWALSGPSGSGEYLLSMASIDLDDPDAGWTEHPLDFTLRDHCSAAHGGRIWLIGGMTVETTWPAVPRVYDPAADTWSEGPELPLRSPIKGFGCGAVAHAGRLYINTAEGIMRLAEDESAWETVAQLEEGRLFGALVAHDGRLLLVGGGIGMNVTPQDTVDVIPLGD